MTATAHAMERRGHQQGVGLVETMVGILIGMIVILVVFNVLSVAEGYKRATIGTSDAQITGLLSQFVAGRDAGNGGAGITMSGADLINCTVTEANAPIVGLPVTDLDNAVRPIPVLITDGGAANVSDSFISYNAGAAHVMWPVDFTASSAAGTAITVQSPNGFTVPTPATTPYWAIAMTNDATGRCKVLRVVAATAADASGRVTLTQGAPVTSVNYSVGPPARLLNLGPVGLATRVRYDVVGDVLRTTDLMLAPPAALSPVPVAQNIVLMKVQYGVDNTGDGIVDCWTPADASTGCGDFSVDTVRVAPLATVNQILAVRIGIVVRSDEPDLRLLTDPSNQTLKDEAKGILSGTRPQPYLFNCSANDDITCQSRIKLDMGGTPDGKSNCGKIICDYWRYRIYETVVPIRNAIYSMTSTITPP